MEMFRASYIGDRECLAIFYVYLTLKMFAFFNI